MADIVELDEVALHRKNLILQNLQEVLGEEKLTKALSVGKNIHIYWGTATTGRPHVGYFVPMQKIADFLHAGIKVTILFADLHASLDNLKSSYVLLENRVLYYEHIIKALLKALDVPIEKLNFVKGSSYQLSEPYTQDLLRLCGQVSQRDALRAGAEVENPLLSGLLYPLLQALDEQYLKVDGQAGGVDQRKIFILAEEQLPKLKLGKRFHLMNPMVPGLTENTKIDLLDSMETLNRKIDSAPCPELNTENSTELENGVLAFFKFVVLPIQQQKQQIIYINNREYATFDEIREAYEKKHLTEIELKTYLKEFLNKILEKVRQVSKSEDILKIIQNAYPTVNTETEETFSKNFINTSEEREKLFSQLTNNLEV